MLHPEGVRIAKLFRKYRDLADVRCCDLSAILAEDQIELITSTDDDPGYTACLLRSPFVPGGGIILQPGLSPGRERFSIGHELGHFHIPSHENHGPRPCGARDLESYNDHAKEREWQANSFAAELLMPFALFSADARNLQADFQAVQRLASDDFYNVSLTAAAIRLVETTLERCALIVTADETIEWTFPSRSFRLRTRKRGESIQGDTLNYACLQNGDVYPAAEEVDPLAWLHLDYPAGFQVMESAMAIPVTGQVLSLVWIVEDS